jgi:thiamine-phosphate pyrophosphorylase
MTSAERPFPRLIAITDLERAGATETLARFEALASGARPGTLMLQLRDRERPARERLELGGRMAELCRRTGQLFQVNDRLDLAVLLGADAVHLGEASVATPEARRVVGAGVMVTRACHAVEQLGEVDAEGVVLSPILAARKGRAALGVGVLQGARASLEARGSGRRHLVALGGIDAAGVGACFAAGADAVAVVGAGLDEGGMTELLEAAGIRRV